MTQNTQAPTAQTSTRAASSVLGEMVFLLTKSPAHQFLFLNDLEWLVLPPLASSQYFVFKTPDQKPLAFALWAFVSEEVHERLSNFVMRLSPGDWRSGEIPWIIEWVAPFGHDEVLLGKLREFLGADRFHMIGTNGADEPIVQKL